MGELRIPETTKNKIMSIKHLTDTKQALEETIDLLLNFYQKEENVPIEYDSQSGKPIDYTWRPHTEYEMQLDIGSLSPRDPLAPFDKGVIDEIRANGPLLVNTKFGKYAVWYEQLCESQHDRGSSWLETYHVVKFLALQDELW